MENINRVKNVVDYYVLCNKLKQVIRAGWINWKVERDRIESVAEHVYGVQQLAIAMWSEYDYDIDIFKVIFMLAVHELEEIVIGDLTMWDITPDEKLNMGHSAVQTILKDLLEKEEIEKLIHEFDARETKEAKFAYFCDKLECDIQSKLYDEEASVDLTNQNDNPSFHDKKVQKLLKEKDSWSAMWLAFSRDRCNYDANFTEVSNYVENNNISKLRKKL